MVRKTCGPIVYVYYVTFCLLVFLSNQFSRTFKSIAIFRFPHIIKRWCFHKSEHVQRKYSCTGPNSSHDVRWSVGYLLLVRHGIPSEPVKQQSVLCWIQRLYKPIFPSSSVFQRVHQHDTPTWVQLPRKSTRLRYFRRRTLFRLVRTSFGVRLWFLVKVLKYVLEKVLNRHFLRLDVASNLIDLNWRPSKHKFVDNKLSKKNHIFNMPFELQGSCQSSKVKNQL